MNPNQFWRMFEDEWFTPKYRLKKLLGAGSFGAVFLADDVVADRVMREVAIKIFSDESGLQERQIAELQTAISLKHPNLLEGFSPEQGWLKGIECLGLVMELAQDSLGRRLQRGSLPLAEVKTMVKNLASALDYLHGRSIVHRDLKPANIMQVGGLWKLTDFGISRLLENRNGSETLPSHQVGTIAYAPPESYTGKISLTWDLWSLGMVIAETLTGKHPFAGNTIEQMMQRVRIEDFNFASELPAPFTVIVQGCLVKDYTKRWTAAQVLAALDPTSDLGRVTVLLPLSPSFRKVLPAGAEAQGYVSIPNSGIRIEVEDQPNIRLTEDISADKQGKHKSQPMLPKGAAQGAIALPNRRVNYQERLPGGAILDMIAIPAGSFLMGSATEDIEQVLRLESWFKRSDIEKWLRPEMPQHRVSVPAFCMSKTPITQEQWQAVCTNNPSQFSSPLRPVENVSWWDALEFCDRLSQLTGKPYCLPTEAEWEYACRAGTQTLYSFSNRKQLLPSYAWYTWNARNKTQQVGQKKPNAWGLFDLHGLVWEWCEDTWHESYSGAPMDGSAWSEAGHPTKHVVRGGSWYSLADDCRCAHRFCFDANFRYSSIGFRVVTS
ncbi:serine/threonine protein kinase [Brasilonema octagenarum UFV-E1]|uniref:Serine/threonine protein kinase n=1 Tax=Brasilonema sennae CENA114 TaxID=415709 RepID=A0A856MN29_9CYAN|nr:bifunctional serine/threonine-protein kinase/formylglycine-generating enzyme family protein [Brasilonema sennae]QDL11514.1 serine/threonine protein kinase [Brasilonema sennae CENA114]QDL17896.1 serine/threonine protein kinase [Brasilonema octagenarum UFV-E1]